MSMTAKWKLSAKIKLSPTGEHSQQKILSRFQNGLKASIKDQKRGDVSDISVFETDNVITVALEMIVKTRGDQESEAINFVTKAASACCDDMTCIGLTFDIEPYFASRYETDPRRETRELLWRADVHGKYSHTGEAGVAAMLNNLEEMGRVRLSKLSETRSDCGSVFTFSARLETVCVLRGDTEGVSEFFRNNLMLRPGFSELEIENVEPLLAYNKYAFPDDSDFEIDMKLAVMRILSESFSFSTAEAIWSKIGNELIAQTPHTTPINQKSLRVLIGRCLCEMLGLKTTGKGAKA